MRENIWRRLELSSDQFRQTWPNLWRLLLTQECHFLDFFFQNLLAVTCPLNLIPFPPFLPIWTSEFFRDRLHTHCALGSQADTGGEKNEYNMNYWTRIKWILSMVNDSASGETNVGWKLWRWIREEGPWLPTTKLFRHLWGMRHALLVSWTDSCFRSFEELLGTGWQRHICDERHGALWAAPRWAISGARGCHQSD